MDDLTLQKIKNIFSEAVGLSEDDINDSIAYNSCELWDSLIHLQLVSELEDEFNIELDMDDIIAMETFGKIIDIVDQYIQNKG